MALRQPVNLTDKASLSPITSGAALTAELSNVAYPETSGKRAMFDLVPINRGASTGTVPVELFIGGLANFRLRPADQSAMFVRVVAVYTTSVGSSDATFELVFAVTNRGGTVAILANSTTVRMPAAVVGSSTLVPTIVGGNIILTATGTAGDVNGRWAARAYIAEVTDLG